MRHPEPSQLTDIAETPTSSQESSVNWAERVEGLLAEHPKSLLGLSSAIFFAVAISLARIKVYWFDELITLYMVRGHTFQGVWRALKAGVDQNPPLNHLLTLPLHVVFGDNPIAMRLPGMFAFWIAGVAAYLFLRKRVPALFALGAVLYLGATRAFDYSFDARSYGLLMACGMVALLSWQELTEVQNRRLGFAGLALALAAGVSSHYYAVLLFAPIAAGELVRTLRARKVDFAPWVAQVIGALPLIAYWPLIRVDMRVYTAYAWNAPRVRFLWSGYEALLEETIWPVMALFATAIVIWYTRQESKTDKRVVPAHEMAAIITLVALPAVAYALAVIKTGQVSSRYVLPSAFGVAIAVGIAAAKVCRQKAIAGIALCLVALSWSAVRTSLMARELLERRQQFSAFIAQPALKGEMPILCGDSMAILPLTYYGDAQLRNRLVFANDLPAVREYQKEDSAEQTLYAGRGIVFPIAEQQLADFRRAHSTYLVLSNEQGWLVKKLRANGVRLREMIDKDKFYKGQVDPLFRMSPQLWLAEE